MVDWMENFEQEKIEFYSTRGEHGCFSNFSRHPVRIFGRTWKTSEHAYQAAKFIGTSEARVSEIHKAKGPGQAAALGRDRSVKMRQGWDKKKRGVMREVVLAKFRQNKDIQEVLLDTGDALLVEHTDRDSIWGDGGDGTGTNWLGKVLMEVRKEIRDFNEVQK